MKTTAIIQARLNSTRLPGKVLVEIKGRPMLWYVVDRTLQARTIDLAVVATTTEPEDDRIVDFCLREGIPCFRGSRDDVLDRYYQAARRFGADPVVRITSDCPLLDPRVVDEVVLAYQTGDCDFCGNGVIKRTYPDGLDTGIFSFAALETTWRNAKLKSEREHVSPYLQKHPELFRLKDVLYPQDLSGLRWTVDEARDLDFVRRVYDFFPDDRFGMAEILALLQRHPELAEINAGIECNEGYQKSLAEDGLYPGLEA